MFFSHVPLSMKKSHSRLTKWKKYIGLHNQKQSMSINTGDKYALLLTADETCMSVCMDCICPSILALPLHLHHVVQSTQDSIMAGAVCVDVSTRLSSRSGGGGVRGEAEMGGRAVDMVFASKRMTMMSLACRRGNKRPHPLFIWVTN